MGQTGPVPAFAVPLTWVGVEDVPIVFVNQMLVQVDDRADVLVAFGQASPPPLVGSAEEQMAQAQRLAYVPVKPVARFTMSRSRVVELIGILNQVLEIQDRVRDQIRAAGQGDNL